MDLRKYKTLILVTTAVVALLVASPAIQAVLTLPQKENITELWLLGPNHDTKYPTNVTQDQTYRLYLDISNHLGASAYYEVQIKFRNQTQSAPNSFTHTNSQLPPIGSLTAFTADNQTVELPIDVSFHYSINDRDSSRLQVQDITINGQAIDSNSITIAYDSQKGGFYGDLFFELYIYNQATNTLQYHERYVSLWLKINT